MTQVPPPAQPPTPPAPPFFPPAPDRSPHRPRRARFAVAVLTGALLVGGGAGVGGAALYEGLRDEPAGGTGTTAPLQVADSTDTKAPSGSVEAVAAAVLPSVVALDVTAGGGPSGESGSGSGSGSGVVIDASGLILTNDHVVTLGGQIPADQAEVTASFHDGRKARATVVGTDPLTDTALVRVEGVKDLKPITIGKSADLAVGEQVVAIGSPFGLDATVTSGIVSALNRPVEVARDESGRSVAYPAIQTDAAINPGNSGGPLVNMDGQLVGINASIRTAGSMTGSESGSIGLGFAIPIDEVLPIVEQIRNGETPTHARLGIEVSDIPDGARIERIEDGSAASDAGLRAGDVITAIDDRPISDSESLIATVRSYRPGETVKITYLRDGKEQTTELELGSDG